MLWLAVASRTPRIGCADQSSTADAHVLYCYIPNPNSCFARPGTVPSMTATVDMDKQGCVLQLLHAKVSLQSCVCNSATQRQHHSTILVENQKKRVLQLTHRRAYV